MQAQIIELYLQTSSGLFKGIVDEAINQILFAKCICLHNKGNESGVVGLVNYEECLSHFDS